MDALIAVYSDIESSMPYLRSSRPLCYRFGEKVLKREPRDRVCCDTLNQNIETAIELGRDPVSAPPADKSSPPPLPLSLSLRRQEY